ncbi:hypothetical protein CDAR_546661 [Caerostris darwini]|uniref:Uncharacterized protein n=1 Tax=Caerostris darwini TaxID=1538125 RepID=A0AAV4PDG0_9ARAC|nr:hypothetical protein CDAR_546661 [Caerostris darwini]
MPEPRNQPWVASKGSARRVELTKQKWTIIIPLLTEDAKTADSENRLLHTLQAPACALCSLKNGETFIGFENDERDVAYKCRRIYLNLFSAFTIVLAICKCITTNMKESG